MVKARPIFVAVTLLLGIFIIQTIILLILRRPQPAPYVLPKLIWIYWDSPELPRVIEQVRQYNAVNLADWTTIYLNQSMLSTYVTAYPEGYADLSVAHKSDWLRLYLLSTYGGCWLDAGIIVNTPAAMNDLYNESLLVQSDLTCFQTGSATFAHRSGRVLPKLIDNWCIMAPKNSLLIKLWRSEFERAIRAGFLNYKRAAVKRGVDISAIHFEGPDDVYLTQHITIQSVIQDPMVQIPPMVVKYSKTSMFKLHTDCKWDSKCVAERLNNDTNVRRIPYIKLTRHDRKMNLDRFFVGA